MDNASSNTKFLEHLARTADFSESQPVRCFAHTTNLAVKDSLKFIDPLTVKVCETEILKIKFSNFRLNPIEPGNFPKWVV